MSDPAGRRTAHAERAPAQRSHGYVCVSPRGIPLRHSLRPTADEAWAALQAAAGDPGTLHENGYRVWMVSIELVREAT